MPDTTPPSLSLYDRAVRKITEWVKPGLHRVSQQYIKEAIEENAHDNPRYARMIEFEVRRRGDGAGITQDVAEPLLWTGVKTGLALGVATATHSLNNKKFQMVGYATALGVMVNNGVEWARLLPRYKAGLQGSLEMAKDRWKSIEENGIDPFSSQTREINAKHKTAAEIEREKTQWQDDINIASEIPPKSYTR